MTFEHRVLEFASVEPVSLQQRLMASSEPFLDPAITSTAARAKLHSLAARLPDLTDHVAYRVSLDGKSPRVDFGLALAASHKQLLARALHSHARSFGAVARGWERIAHFAQLWSDSAAASLAVPSLFLEFAAQSADSPLPVPALFALIGSRPARDIRAQELRALRSSLQILAGDADPHTRELQRRAAHCHELLPNHSRLLQVGALLGHPGQPVRLSVAIHGGEVEPYLQRVGWKGNRSELALALELATRFSPLIELDFDPGEPMLSRVCLALRPETPEHWRGLLDALAYFGFAGSPECRGLIAWTGRHWLSLETSQSCVVNRYLSHVQLCCGDGEISARSWVGAIAHRTLGPEGGAWA